MANEMRSGVPATEEADEESKWTGTYTWHVENFSNIQKQKIYSPEFEIGTYTWCPHTLRGLYGPMANHAFSNQAADWGFAEFLPIQDTLNPRRGFVVNDTLILRTTITVQREDQLSRMTRRQTGFVGLKNQGHTCYLNSLLQYLYHIHYFRKAVYRIPTQETDKMKHSIPLALQSLFHKLQYHNSSVDTKDLFKSFGWGAKDADLQHDIQEMQTLLCEILEQKMEGTEVENAIRELFVGHCSNYVECLNVDCMSVRRQPYREIQLDVLGCKDVYESLERFCAEEKMEGQNKYSTENFGLQVEQPYDCFPPVLQLYPKRFKYDPIREFLVKINGHYEFYDELNLDYKGRAFLSENSNRAVENKYKLHSVLVHTGSPQGGHFYALIKSNSKWYKFDDELVKETDKHAIDKLFGNDDEGSDDEGGVVNVIGSLFDEIDHTEEASVYMLVYIRVSDWDRVMCPVGKEDILEPIRKRIEAEQFEKERRQREKQEAHLYVVIKLATERHFAEQLGKTYHFDLANFDNVKSYRLRKKTLFEDFKEIVSKDFGIPKHLQRYWLWTQRENKTLRPDKPLLKPGNTSLTTVLDLRHFRDTSLTPSTVKNALMTFKLFLETPEAGVHCIRALRTTELSIFVKLYQPSLRKLSYVGQLFVKKTAQFRTIFETARWMAGLPPEADIIGFKEVEYVPTIVCLDLQPAHTPQAAEIVDGDIIIIQERVTEAMMNEYIFEHPTVKSFLEFIQNKTIVNFRPLENPKDDGFKLELLKTMTYEQVTAELASYLKMDDPKKIRLTQHNVYAHLPHRSPIKYNGIDNLDTMILHSRQYTNILYYEVLDMQLPYLEKMKCMRICFHNSKSELQSEHQIRIPREKTIGDLVELLKEELGEEYAKSDIRVMEILSSKIFKVLDHEDSLEKVYETYWTFRAEVIPDDEKNLKADEYLVHCCHCKPDAMNVSVFGDPIWIKVKKGETVRDVKKRIQAKLEIPDEEFKGWKFAYHPRQMQPLNPLGDNDDIIAQFPRGLIKAWIKDKYFGDNGSFIAMQHEEGHQAHQRIATIQSLEVA